MGFTRPLTERMSDGDCVSSSLNAPLRQITRKSSTSCGHYAAGQDLCHLCHQRAKRNIPVYLHEEKRIREAEEEKLLEQYQHNRDLDEQKKREVHQKNFPISKFLFFFCLDGYESSSRRKTKDSRCMSYQSIDIVV